jgi:hypothetical protein
MCVSPSPPCFTKFSLGCGPTLSASARCAIILPTATIPTAIVIAKAMAIIVGFSVFKHTLTQRSYIKLSK